MPAMADRQQSWEQTRRTALVAILASRDLTVAVSSGCAATGAARHAADIESRAAAALRRLDDGLADSCEGCGGPIPRERLDAVVTATRCVQCVGTGAVDTRWCR